MSMEKNFQVGDVVVYKASGVYRIVDIGMPGFARDKRLAYFTLKELDGKNANETLYVPISSTLLLRHVIDKTSAEAYLDGFAQLEPSACSAASIYGRASRYQEIVDSYSMEEQLKLLKEIYLKKMALKRGQKPLEIDDQYREMLEQVICEELSVVLNVPEKQIKERLYGSLKRGKNAK